MVSVISVAPTVIAPGAFAGLVLLASVAELPCESFNPINPVKTVRTAYSSHGAGYALANKLRSA